MYHWVSKLVLYGSMPENTVLMQLCRLCREADREKADRTGLPEKACQTAKKLLTLSAQLGFDGNLWQCYLSYLLVSSENPFTLACERRKAGEGTLTFLAQRDLALFYQLFHYDFKALEKKLGTDIFSCLIGFRSSHGSFRDERICSLAQKLNDAGNEEKFFSVVTDFYTRYGVGSFGLNRAFRIREEGNDSICITPITNMDPAMLSDLVGYEIQKKKLVDNTASFVEGRAANNVLLYGDSGTGKSTSVKAMVNEFYGRGLRIVEVQKYQFRYLPDLIAQIKGRNYKFIIFMDDLSFEDYETEYKYLKAVIEGGVETRPDNILIYATSNRRHLIKETWKDRDDMETAQGVHKSDNMEEKLSLASRFGVTINFSKPGRKDYMAIVRELSARNGITMPEEKMESLASQWGIAHGGLSGRTARQFVIWLCGIKQN